MNRNHIVVIIVTIAVSIAVFVAVMFHKGYFNSHKEPIKVADGAEIDRCLHRCCWSCAKDGRSNRGISLC